MKKIEVLKKAVTSKAGRHLLKLKKHSPEILLVLGIGGIAVGVVLACKATLKVEDIVDDAKEKLDKIHDAKDNVAEVDYSNFDYRKDVATVYIQTGVKLARVYGPSFSVISASVGCIIGSHNILKSRNAGLVAAYVAVQKGFNEYRDRVVDEFGEDKDREYKYGVKVDKVAMEDGSEITRVKDVKNRDKINSEYARFFAKDTTLRWTPTPEYNLMFLKCQQNYANDLLNSRGHIFLNEVYDLLGFERSKAGTVVGWVKDNGDDFVDFGIFDGADSDCRFFVNGQDDSVLLDFNVDGIIWDLI